MSKRSFGSISKIADSFAAAAVNPALWQEAMETAAEVTGSVGAALLPVRGHLPVFPVSESLSGLLETYVQKAWYQRDERARGIPIMTRRGVMTDLDFAHPDEFAHSTYYQELLAPLGLQWFAGVKVGAGEDLWCLSIQRTPDQGPFSPYDLKRLGILSQKLSSAAALARALGFARAEAVADAYEMSGSAVVLFDRLGEVTMANPSAERLFGPCLHIVKKRLASIDPRTTAALDCALHDLIWQTTGSSLSSPIVVPRREGRPILVYLCRSTRVTADCFSPCHAIGVLVDLEAKVSLIEADLVRTFHLTSAEARLVNCLLGGESIEVAAKGLNISYETSRTQLKTIFQKTGTHRQAELITLLARFKRQG